MERLAACCWHGSNTEEEHFRSGLTFQRQSMRVGHLANADLWYSAAVHT